MLLLRSFAVVSTLCLLLVTGSPAVADQEVPDVDDDVPAVSSQRSNTGLLAMLAALKGTNAMGSVVSFFNDYKVLTSSWNFLSDSPLYKNIMMAAARKNPSLNMLSILASKRSPDVKDLFRLATNSRKKYVQADFNQVAGSSRKHKAFIGLLDNPLTLTSPAALGKMFKLFSGKDVVFGRKLVADYNSGSLVVTPQNVAKANLLDLINFGVKNARTIRDVSQTALSTGDESVLTRYLQILAGLDFSMLMNIKMVKHPLKNDKYIVSTGDDLVPNPNVAQLTADLTRGRTLLKQKARDDNTVSGSLQAILKDMSSLFDETIKDVPSASPSRPVQQALV